jgi:hypothetical protein
MISTKCLLILLSIFSIFIIAPNSSIAEDAEVYRPVNELYFWPLSLALILSLFIAILRLPLLSFFTRRMVEHA